MATTESTSVTPEQTNEPERSWKSGSRLRIPALAAVGVPLTALVLLVAAWAIDASVGGRQVMRNVSVMGRDVGGLSDDDL
ncbi:MAG: hypothetical protein OEY23_19660, partial [Acidimicrobiia bacterium]|nr:hypothetical protein [Acidimicrobiia bacterium]